MAEGQSFHLLNIAELQQLLLYGQFTRCDSCAGYPKSTNQVKCNYDLRLQYHDLNAILL
jgi:hypothetical protein